MARYLKTSLTKQARVFVPYFFVLLGMHSPDAFELIKSSQQNEKTPFIKILAAHCCCYNRLSHAMTLWSSGTDECGHQSQLPLKRKGFDSLHLFCSVLDPDTKSKCLHITGKCKFQFWSPCLKSGPTLIVEAPKASLSSKRGFALSHEIISMFRLHPRSPRALTQTLQTLLVNSHVAWGLNDKQ